MKPILFNTEMVRAIRDGRKTVTRRVVKEPWFISDEVASRLSGLAMHRGYAHTDGMPCPDRPYRPGDILYVRETWCRQPSEEYPFVYRASVETPDAWKGQWRPSIHMPKEAARLFLRVKAVRVQRLHDMTTNSAMDEGFTDWNDFARCWDSTIKPADRALYGWAADPWVWVIEFERISKEEAL